MVIFKDVLNKVMNDDKTMIDALNSASFLDFPDWTPLRKRIQTGKKTIMDHTLAMYGFLFKMDNYKRLNADLKLVLKIAVMLHDISKQRGGEPLHEIRCAERSNELLTKWGYSKDFIDFVYFLVRYHSYLGIISSKFGEYKPLLDELMNVLRKTKNFKDYILLLGLLNKVDVLSQYFVHDNVEMFKTDNTDRIDLLADEILSRLH
ncbi:Uncharacterised protein [Candidatus Tiddalikarchaeum anstoanum]|nr:Uncharacterised protein [Candidatus Tiddalikarchaeum anstoanum]